MTTLTERLAAYLTDEIRAALENASGNATLSSAGDSVRLSFAGPSAAQLGPLFERLTCEQGQMRVSTNQGLLEVPVYLVDPSATDPDDGRLAAKCTPDYLVSVRNKGFAVLLALHEVGVGMNQSLSTTMKPLGVRADVENADQWIREPLIERLVTGAIAEIFGGQAGAGARNAIEWVLKETWEADERHRDKRNAWKVLESLAHSKPNAPPHLHLAATLGLPACAEEELGSSAHLGTLSEIVEFFQKHGLQTGFAELRERAGKDLLPHLVAFQVHIDARGIIDAGEFARAPAFHYSPDVDADGHQPLWWKALSLDVWAGLLDADSDPGTSGTLKLRVLNQVAVVPRGMPCIVRHDVEFEVTVSSSADNTEVSVGRGVGQSTLATIGTLCIQGEGPEHFEDSDVPSHDRFIRYRFDATGFASLTVKAIVLDSYSIGVVACARSAKKLTPFRFNKKAKDEKNQASPRYECSVELSGMGSHSLDLYTSTGVVLSPLIRGHNVNAEQEAVLERPLVRTTDYCFTCLIETDEESYYDFEARLPDEAEWRPFRIYITADEIEPAGVTSEFDRLVIDNRASARREAANSRVEPINCRATNLEEWALEDEHSFHPLLLGPDYLDAWARPSWSKQALLSAHALPVDPRPSSTDFVPPSRFLAARKDVLNRLRTWDGEESTPSAGLLHLHSLMRDEAFRSAISELVDSYASWLQEDYENAAWCDTVGLMDLQAGASALQAIPYAILLTPFHPIRLAWQCRAQELLQSALQLNAPCPAASVLTPAFFPDALLLPCRSGAGHTIRKPFAAMASSSDYWGVLWSLEAVGKLGVQGSSSIFGTEFGISVEGLSSGFSAQQVTRSLDEVSRLLSAKPTLRVGVSSDTAGSGSCNDGIAMWCASNLGPEADPWVAGGKRSLVIIDHRDRALQPEQSAMASLTNSSGASLSWFNGTADKSADSADLSIIAHLGTMNHEFSKQGIRSAIDSTCLTRWRVRKQLAVHPTPFIAESRSAAAPASCASETLSEKLVACVYSLESRCSEDFDSYVFAPNMGVLHNAVGTSSYTAVSSSHVDATCFFGSANKTYLWDYELPSYARRAGENGGYFLLARESEGMLLSVKQALGLLGTHGPLDDDRISALLAEISRRGMPTLKRLTRGGSMSLGEVGMLVALRLLQAEFEGASERTGLLPVRGREGTLNLVVPADPFKNHFDDLRQAIDGRYGERPDLIVMSIGYASGEPRHLKVTPVEVKARGYLMPEKERGAAISQASRFGTFLERVQHLSAHTELWGLAWRSIVASLLDYAFRVYGQLDQFMKHESWALQHAAALRALATNQLEVSIDTRGRLIIIDESNSSAPIDHDCDGFAETIVLSHKDAYRVLLQDATALAMSIRNIVDDWCLESRSLSDSVGHGDPRTEGHVNPIPEVTTPDKPREKIVDSAIAEKRSDSDVEPVEVNVAGVEMTVPLVTGDRGIEFPVGHTLHEFVSGEVRFCPGNTELTQLNVGIVGDLGTGKTQLIQALVFQLCASAENNRGCKPNVLIFDYKKDYSKPGFVNATGATVVQPFDIPLNIFDTSNIPTKRNAWLERARFFCDILEKLYKGIGPVQRERIMSAVKESYDSALAMGRPAPTMRDVFDTYKRAPNAVIDTPYSIMSEFVAGGYFVNDAIQVKPFAEFLNGVVVIDLAEVGQDDRTKNMLVVVLLNMLYEHMLRIEKKPFVGHDPQYRFVDTMLLVDEADNIMQYEFDVLKKILLQGREFGVGVLLASQYLSHFKTARENYREPLLTWFVHKVPNVTVKELEGIGLSNVGTEDVNKVKALKCHEFLYKTLGIDGKVVRGVPFYKLAGR